MPIHVRSAEGELGELPLVAEHGPDFCAFCTDDREPDMLLREGHVNQMCRVAVEHGIAPEDALVMATLNPATWHGLTEFGAIAPGYLADLLVLPDLESFEPERVLKAGKPLEDVPPAEVPEWVRHTVRIQPVASNDFLIPWAGGAARVIDLIPEQIVTG